MVDLQRIRQQFGDRRTLGADVRSGVTLGVERVPDGLAAGLLAGINPLFGLYGYMVGSVAGALTTSSAFVAVQATAAMAVIIDDVPGIGAGMDAAPQLAMLALMTGALLLVAGLVGFARIVRFVSNAVLVGFVNAVAVTIVLGQLDGLTGYDNDGANKLLQSWDTVTHLGSVDVSTLLLGLGCAVAILLLERTPLQSLGMVVAVVGTSAVAAIADLSSVATVSDIAVVPRSLPMPALPDFSVAGSLVVPALSLAFVAAVQGGAISGTVPNPDGRLPDPATDVRGTGISNLVAGLLQAMPVGASMSATSLVRQSGARTRLANLIAGAVMALLVLTTARWIGWIAMPALAGLLVIVGVRTLRLPEAASVYRSGPNHAAAMIATFAATLVLPLQYAVLVGVAVSVLLHVVRQANRITVHRWVHGDDGRPVEVDPPPSLDSNDVVVLMVFGSLFFASASTLERLLPAVTPHTRRTTVILRLRGQDGVGTTVLATLRRYAASLDDADSRLVLVGVGPELADQLRATHTDVARGVAEVVLAQPLIGAGVEGAIDRARAYADEGGASADTDD